MDETRIKVLIDKHRQWFNQKIEEMLAHAWHEWSAEATELHVLRADIENRRKEGRAFYKMDENNINVLCEDLTEESHTAAIEQRLEEFNNDQVLFHLEVEPYEEERLATMANRAPTIDEPKVEPSTTTIEERQEGSARVDTTPHQINNR